jgi:hypothetical protein
MCASVFFWIFMLKREGSAGKLDVVVGLGKTAYQGLDRARII